jgi:hypothetical protein
MARLTRKSRHLPSTCSDQKANKFDHHAASKMPVFPFQTGWLTAGMGLKTPDYAVAAGVIGSRNGPNKRSRGLTPQDPTIE